MPKNKKKIRKDKRKEKKLCRSKKSNQKPKNKMIQKNIKRIFISSKKTKGLLESIENNFE